MTDIEDRPVHTVVDCSTGQVTHTPLTDAEWEEYKARAALHTAQQVVQEAENTQLRQAVVGHSDPVVQALARRIGLG